VLALASRIEDIQICGFSRSDFIEGRIETQHRGGVAGGEPYGGLQGSAGESLQIEDGTVEG
jgi:hypothetical protein